MLWAFWSIGASPDTITLFSAQTISVGVATSSLAQQLGLWCNDDHTKRWDEVRRPKRCRQQLLDEMGDLIMVTGVQHPIGNPTRRMFANRVDSRRYPPHLTVLEDSESAGSAPSRSGLKPPHVQAPQYHTEHLGFLDSARMDREMAREMGQSSRRSQKSAMSITAALMNMSNRRLLILGGGVLLLIGGLLALRFPVFLSDFDQWGFQINCGSGFQSTLTQAGIADSAGTQFVDQCHTAIAMRRAWTIPLVVGGALLLCALLVRPSRPHSASAEATGETPSALLPWSSPSSVAAGASPVKAVGAT
jgi:hypothetical protein